MRHWPSRLHPDSAADGWLAVTLDAAYSLKMGKKIGSIVAGKLAIFAILAEHPSTIDRMKIKDIRV